MIHDDLAIFQDLVEGLLQTEQEEPIAQALAPTEIAQVVDLQLSEAPMSDAGFKTSIAGLLRHTPKTTTPLFFNQLFGGRQGKAVIGELLAGMLNNSMYTYKVAGPMVMVEKSIIQELKKLIGYPTSSEGTFATGGSMTNYMAMLMARDQFVPTIKEDGYQDNKKLIAYTSIESHYSVVKNAAFCGIGKNNVRKVASDEFGQMDFDALRHSIQEDIASGYQPFFVNATAGTTVLGVFDPLREIAEICKSEGLWMHIDGAYGGSAIFSEEYRHLMDGCELSDSFSINAHKMLGVPLTCSIIITKHKKALYDSFSIEANYLYQTDTDEINPGKISLQCGRRNDALKLWTLWKSVGTQGLSAIVNKQFHLAEFARDYIRNNDDYTLYHEGPSVNICFNYKNIDPNLLCTSLYKEAELMVGFGSFKSVQFVRLVTLNANNTETEILEFFRRLESHAEVNFS